MQNVRTYELTEGLTKPLGNNVLFLKVITKHVKLKQG
jgi:hypothetical protein